MILTDTSVRTMDAKRPWASAVAITDRRIAAVGTDAEMRAHAGPGTDVVPMPGRAVIPGFQDAHIHPAFAGRNLLRLNLDHLHSVEAYLDAIAVYASEHPEEPWITGGGWAMYLFPGARHARTSLTGSFPIARCS